MSKPQEGAYGVFRWTGTGRYPLHLAVKLHTREDWALRHAARLGTAYVVRWVPGTEILAREAYLARIDALPSE